MEGRERERAGGLKFVSRLYLNLKSVSFDDGRGGKKTVRFPGPAQRHIGNGNRAWTTGRSEVALYISDVIVLIFSRWLM